MAANRRNSTGPRTIAGKLRSSYNALRHGLAASDPRRLVPPGAAERLAGAICDGDEHPALFTAALAIAENELVLDAIRRQKIIAIERLREATSIALRKGDNSLTVAKARFLQAWLANREIGFLVPKVVKKYQDQLTPAFEGDDDVVPIRVKALLEESEPSEEEHQRLLELARTEIARRERDEYDALEEAVPDLTLRTARVVAAEAGDPRIPEPQIRPQAATGTGRQSVDSPGQAAAALARSGSSWRASKSGVCYLITIRLLLDRYSIAT
jgi:hypothetical protein